MLHACFHESSAVFDDVGVVAREEAENRGAEVALVGRALRAAFLSPSLSREPTRTRPTTMRATEAVRIAGPQSKSRGFPLAWSGRCGGLRAGGSEGAGLLVGRCWGLRAGDGSAGAGLRVGRRNGSGAGTGSTRGGSLVGVVRLGWGIARPGRRKREEPEPCADRGGRMDVGAPGGRMPKKGRFIRISMTYASCGSPVPGRNARVVLFR